MYKKDDKLILLSNFGIEGKPGFLKKGTKVLFVRAIDTSDVTKSYVQVAIEDRILTIPELSVSFEDPKMYDRAMKEFNKSLLEKHPEAKLHHPNIILRLFYRLMDKLGIMKLTKKQDLSKIKQIINEE